MFNLFPYLDAARENAAERRAATRFPIERPITYRFSRGRFWSEVNCGKTVNISSTGILFSGDGPLLPGKRLRVAISWPVQLDGKCSLKLVASGNVVRCAGNTIAAKIEKYDFHLQSKTGPLVLRPLPGEGVHPAGLRGNVDSLLHR